MKKIIEHYNFVGAGAHKGGILTHISPVSHICDMYVYVLFKPYFSVKLAGFYFLIVKHTLNILFT